MFHCACGRVWTTYKRLSTTRNLPGIIGAALRGDQLLYVVNKAIMRGVQNIPYLLRMKIIAPEYANSRRRDCDRPADSAQAMSAAVMHLLAGCCNQSSSIVLLQVTNNCQRTHHCGYQGHEVDDHADQNHQSRVPVACASFLVSPSRFPSANTCIWETEMLGFVGVGL